MYGSTTCTLYLEQELLEMTLAITAMGPAAGGAAAAAAGKAG